MAYRKSGINPELISIITQNSLEDIGESPAESMLPGAYTKVIRKAASLINSSMPQKKCKLTCGSCGRNGIYTIGMIAIDPGKFIQLEKSGKSRSWHDGFQFTGYFRCRHCNAAGNWQAPQETEAMLKISILSTFLDKKTGLNRNEVFMGRFVIDEDRVFTWASDAESHFLKKLRVLPDDGWTWNRLGNIYCKGGRADLAAVAYEESLKHDPQQMESHFSLGKILYESGERQAAIAHLRKVLLVARDYQRLEPRQLRNMLSDTLFTLRDLSRGPEEFVRFLPLSDEFIGETSKNKEESAVMFRELDLDFGTFEGMYPLAEVYMGEMQKQIPPSERTLSLPSPVVKKKKKKKMKKRK